MIPNWYKRLSFWWKAFLWLFVFIPVGSVALPLLFFGGIALFEDTREYISQSELKKLEKRTETIYFDLGNTTEVKAQTAAERKSNMVVFRGMKAGWHAVYVIMGVIVLIWLMSVYRKRRTSRGELRGGALGIYCVLLAVAAILEIWYLFSLGMKGAAWFIHDPSTLLIIVNGIMLIVFALAQMYATMNALFDLGSEWDIYFNYEWGLWGIFISIILYTLSRIFNILSDERELLIVLCVLLGQIPQAINMWRAAARYKYSVVNRTLTFIAFYLIVITGTICLTALMLVALIVGLVAYVVMFLLSRESGVSVSSDSETVILKDGTELEGDGNNYRSKDGGYWRKTVGGFERW